MPYNFTLPREDDYITKGFQEGVQLGVRGSALALERRRMDQDEAYRRALLKERALERQQEQEQLKALSELSSSFPIGVGAAQTAQTYDEAIREFSTPSSPSASPSDIVVQQNEWMAANAPKFLALKNGPQVLSALGAISDNYRQTISAFRTNIANVKVAQDNYNLIEKYKVDTPETRALHNQDKSIQRIQEFFNKNNMPFQKIPDDVIRPDGFIDEIKFHNWITELRPGGTAPERAIDRLAKLRHILPSAQTQEEDTAIRSEISALEKQALGAEPGNVTELEKIRFNAISTEMQSKLVELRQINAALAKEDVKDKKGQFTERGTLLMRRKRLTEESIEELKRNLFADGGQVEATTQTPSSERPSNVPPNYVRARHKTTGQLGWADPNDPDVEIIQP